MELPIKHKRGTTVPTAGDLVVGEIAINTATGLCYTKTGAGNVVAIGLDVAANWGNIGGTLSSQTDLQNALDNKYDASNPNGYIQEANVDGNLYGRKNGQWELIPTTDLTGYATETYVTSQGYITSSALAPYLTSATAASTYYPSSNPSNFLTVSNLSGYATEVYVSNFVSTGYASLMGATFNGKVVAPCSTSSAGLNVGALSSTSAPNTTVAGDVWVGQFQLGFRTTAGVKYAANLGDTNSFTRPQVITSATTETTPALRITNLSTSATGYSLLVEDAANPDATPFVIDNAGRVGVGTSADSIAAIKVDAGGIMFSDGTRQTTSASGAGGASWGTIAGTLTNQLDITAALALKANLSGASFTGKVTTTPVDTNTPSLNLGTTAISSSPTAAVNGDIWITNAASPKLGYKTGGVSYYPAVANQFNTFSAGVAISGTSSANQLTISQLGTGNALVVEDETSPDTSAFIINAAGSVGIGIASGWTPIGKLDVNGAITCTTASATDDSTKAATTAHVKSVVRGNVVSVIGPSTYTLPGGGYANTVIRRGSYDTTGNPTTLVVPTNASVPIAIGTQYVLIQAETDPFTITHDPGVGVASRDNKFTSAGLYAVCTLIKTDTDTWYLAGDLIA